MAENKRTLKEIQRLAMLITSKRFSFIIGLHENKNKTEEVRIKNLDGSESVETMTLEDILYFVDRGTISTPAKHILNEIREEVALYYNINFPLWFKEAMKIEKADEVLAYLMGKFYMFNEFINISIIPQVIRNVKNDSAYVNGIIGQDQDNTWFYDINRIKPYIKSKILIK